MITKHLKLKIMQQEFFDDLTIALPYLNDLQKKLTRLQNCKRLINTGEIDLIIFIKQPDSTRNVTLDQTDLPFNLKMELQCLLNDSIDELQRVYDNISTSLHKK
jgi:hypothetical protein